MVKLTLSLLILAFFTTHLQATTEVIRYQLENGFTVILNPDNHQSEVFGMVVVNAGAKHDPAIATGLAHYMEHMLFKGTQELGTTDWEAEKPYIEKIIELYDELANTEDEEERHEIQLKINEESLKANEYVINNELWSILMEMGSTKINASTGPDATRYFNSFPPAQLEKWLEIYSHRFIDPVFRGFQAELEVVYEEKNMYSDMFFWNLQEFFLSNLFKNHPYGQQSIIGSIEHLKNPQLSKMIEFYETYYVANNMALILVGDFDPEEIKPVVDEKFNRLKPGEVPELKEFMEEPFEGRDFVTGKFSPIRLGMLGFRTVPKLHPDNLKLEIANSILGNESSTGLLDRLTIDNKVMFAGIISLPYHDHGVSLLFFVPKLFRQSTSRAESLILEEFENLRKGNFDDDMLKAIKLEKYRDFQLRQEDYVRRGRLFADAFVSGDDIGEILDYPNRIISITKDDIVEVANKYYGDDFLAFHSKRGNYKAEKIEQPGYEPIISNTEARSEYARKLDEMNVADFDYIPVDFDNDVQFVEIKPLAGLHVSENPLNDVFELTVRYNVGHHDMPGLKHLATVMNYAGTQEKSTFDLKTEFGKIGCTYSFFSNESYFTIRITGIENNLSRALELINSLMQNTVIDRTARKKIWEEERLTRRMETSQPIDVADILYEYVKYGENSPYIYRFKRREVRRLRAKDMLEELENLKNYELKFHFTGKTDPQEVAEMIASNYEINDNLIKGTAPIHRELQQYPENTVFFVNDKNAVQSNIFFFINGIPYDISDRAAINAFNTYFGGSFLGLALEEIREFRSLSYAVSGRYATPTLKGKEGHFAGYVGTQADKTIEAVEVYSDLLVNLPEKPQKTDKVRNYLSYSGQMQKPDFRSLSFQVNNWKNEGYKHDPYLSLRPAYDEIDFNTIRDFHNRYIKDKPIVIAIVGDEDRIDMDVLEKFGKLVELRKRDLYKR